LTVVELLEGLTLAYEPAPDGLAGWAMAAGTFASHPGRVHGGIIATLLDELMGRAAKVVLGSPAVTMTIRCRYIAPMNVGVRHGISADIQSCEKRIARVSGRLEDEAGDLIVSATATFTCVPDS